MSGPMSGQVRGQLIDGSSDRRVRHSASRPIGMFVVAVLAGAGLGVIARLWMRWISTDPEFTWSGTIAIVVAFIVFASAQASAAAVRRHPARPRTVAVTRAVAAVLSFGLFGAAGAVMFPTVVFGSIAVWRTGAPRAVRAVCAILAMPSVVFVTSDIVSDFGWTIATIARLALFLAIYACVVAATWPTMFRQDVAWSPARATVATVVLGVVAVLGFALFMGGIQ